MTRRAPEAHLRSPVGAMAASGGDFFFRSLLPPPPVAAGRTVVLTATRLPRPANGSRPAGPPGDSAILEGPPHPPVPETAPRHPPARVPIPYLAEAL